MCRMYGGYLAEIITASENTFLTGYTQNQGSMSEFLFDCVYMSCKDLVQSLIYEHNGYDNTY